jgi:hypothetical protein
MEAGVDSSRAARTLLLALAVVLLIRLPFLNQAIQGDEDIYRTEAEHALIDPLHPTHTPYVFMGDVVDLRGHSHPPLNGWVLAGLIAAVGDIREVPFHAAYIGFSLIAAASMWSLARRFSPRPLWATLLFLAVPVFVVNGNSLEADLPFLAFWMAAIALFTAGRIWLAAPCLAVAALGAYQGVFLTPILALWVWLFRRRDRAAWALTLTPVIAIGAFQVFTRLTTGSMPASVLAGYFSTYGLQALEKKLRSAVMLAIHAAFLVFPLLAAPAAAQAWKRRREPETAFLLGWIGLFFAGAVAVFFAGSARYLLPMAAPVALLASRLPVKWLAPAFAVNLAIGLGLAAANYEHWDGYRDFARELRPATAGRRVWVNAEWGLRFYLEADGALPLTKKQPVKAGDVVVSSELLRPVDLTAPVAPIAVREIRPAAPFRLIALESASGFSSVDKGFWPFGLSTGLVDRVRAELVIERRATAEYLMMNAPEAKDQIVSGVYNLEEGRYRWMADVATLLLKTPAEPLPIRATFSIPANAPGRAVRLLLDGKLVAARTFAAPGTYSLESPPQRPDVPSAVLTLAIDKTFQAPGDARALGMVLTGAGFAR